MDLPEIKTTYVRRRRGVWHRIVVGGHAVMQPIRRAVRFLVRVLIRAPILLAARLSTDLLVRAQQKTIDDLRWRVQSLEQDLVLAKRALEQQAEIIERDRERVALETAQFARQIAEAQSLQQQRVL